MLKRIVQLTIGFLGIMQGAGVFAQRAQAESVSGPLTSMAPTAPRLCAPYDGDTLFLSEETNLSWHPLVHTASYRLMVTEDPAFTDPVMDLSGIVDTLYSPIGLEPNTWYYWRVSASNVAGEGEYSESRSFITAFPVSKEDHHGSEWGSSLPLPFSPNPFSLYTSFTCHLKASEQVSVIVFDVLGQPVRHLFTGFRDPGEYKMVWDGTDDRGRPVPSGLYLCRLKTGFHVTLMKIQKVNP